MKLKVNRKSSGHCQSSECGRTSFINFKKGLFEPCEFEVRKLQWRRVMERDFHLLRLVIAEDAYDPDFMKYSKQFIDQIS